MSAITPRATIPDEGEGAVNIPRQDLQNFRRRIFSAPFSCLVILLDTLTFVQRSNAKGLSSSLLDLSRVHLKFERLGAALFLPSAVTLLLFVGPLFSEYRARSYYRVHDWLRECYYTLDWRWLRTVVVAPCVEELIFRGCILFHLKRELKSCWSLCLASAGFFALTSTTSLKRFTQATHGSLLSKVVQPKYSSQHSLERTPLLLSFEPFISSEIRKLEEAELDLSDLDNADSPYLRLDHLKRQHLRVWNQLCRVRKISPRCGRVVRRRFACNDQRPIWRSQTLNSVHGCGPTGSEVLLG
nr:unnamed protein product [Spirometra erinaceieuropaei]